MNNNKFVLDKSKYRIEPDGVVVYRVRALRGFYSKSGYVNEGDYGGFVQSERNLGRNRSCWIYGDTVVRDDAYVCGDAVVMDCQVDKNATICDLSIVANSNITDNAVVSGKTTVLNSFVSGNAVVSGPTRLYKSQVTGNACVFEKVCLERVTIDECVGSFLKKERYETCVSTHKYTLVPLSGDLEGLFRLRANEELINYCAKTNQKVIPEGALGGIVSGAHNLSKHGDCWIDYDSMVLGNASVHDYAFVTGRSVLCENAVACGSTLITNCILSGNAYAAGRSKLKNITLGGKSRVFGSAKLGNEYGGADVKFCSRHNFDNFSVATHEDLMLYQGLAAGRK